MAEYSNKAQPYLDAIALGFFDSHEFRNWLIDGTRMGSMYQDAKPLHDEQRKVRWKKRPTKQPFWANYHCGKDKNCECRIENSKSLESSYATNLTEQLLYILNSNAAVNHSNSASQRVTRFGQNAFPKHT
jgi:hypothetical protein